MEIEKEELVSFSNARKILEDKGKESKKDLGYEQNNALEHLKKFSKLSMRKSEALFTELGKIKRLKDRHKILIINTLPKDLDDVRILFAHEIISLSEDEKKSILASVKKSI